MSRTLQIFEEILSIPRESGNESKIADYIVDFAITHNCEVSKDRYNNVFIKKDNKSNKTIILQAHSDMVCVSNNNYDFDNKGIPFYIKGDFYKSNNTSLGADDGIGLAIILAMLEEKDNMPNIEVMITVQEETTMLGAMNFDYSKLTGNTLISLDGIKEADIECSSAGMCSLTLTKNIDYSQNENNTYKMIINGLAGGHSGDDIHKNRCNAIKLSADILNKIEDFDLVDINIGTKDNVIPNEGYIIFKSSKELNEINNLLDSLELNLSNDDSNININVENINETEFITQSKDIIDFILNLEDGLLETFKDDNFPLLSSNIGKISVSKNVLEIKLSIRSADKEKEIEQLNKLKQLCAKYNFNLNLDAQKPFFPFKENSEIRKILSETYNELYGKETIVKKVHACMEGGIISSNIKDLDICTIAPTINNCHSTNERVSISSTERVYKWLKEALIKFNGR